MSLVPAPFCTPFSPHCSPYHCCSLFYFIFVSSFPSVAFFVSFSLSYPSLLITIHFFHLSLVVSLLLSLSPCVGAWMWFLFSASPQTFCTNFFPSIHASSPPTASALQPSTNPSNGLVVHFVFIRQLSVRPAGQSVITSSG